MADERAEKIEDIKRQYFNDLRARGTWKQEEMFAVRIREAMDWQREQDAKIVLDEEGWRGKWLAAAIRGGSHAEK